MVNYAPPQAHSVLRLPANRAQHRLVLPEQNAQEAAQLPDLEVFAATHLKQVCEHLAQSQLLDKVIATAQPQLSHSAFDLVDVKRPITPTTCFGNCSSRWTFIAIQRPTPVQVKPYWHPDFPVFYRP